MISFVIPTFNSVTFLPHAVSSCLQQTMKDIEVVIVNDGSTDRTGEYLAWASKNDERVKVLSPGKNLGRSEARNLGNGMAKGEIICVLDADDLATPNRAEIVAKKFKSGKVDYLYGAATVIDVLGRPSHILGADVLDKNICFTEEGNPLLENYITHSTVAYTKEISIRFPYRGGAIADLGIDDWAQQIDGLAAGASFDFVPQRLACYRQLKSQVTRNRDSKAVLEAKRGFLAGLKVAA